jgi:hypothetical protein
VQLNLSATKLKSLAASIFSFQSEIEKVVAAAYAEALASAYNYKIENGCLVFVNAGGCVWTEGHPDERTGCGSQCRAIAYSEGAVESSEAVAEAGVLLFFLHLRACMP